MRPRTLDEFVGQKHIVSDGGLILNAIKKGTLAPQAAGKIHTDFERGFIRADVVKYDDLITLRDYALCREKGKVASVGKDYVVQDGDIVIFKFNV